MPLYEYRCDDCGTEFEVLQKVSDEPLTACRSCAGSVQKLISRSAFKLKGTGWYITDYAKKKDGGSTEAKESITAKEGGTKSDTSATSDTSTKKPDASSKASSDSKPSAPAKKKP